tara:strand:+ start:250 stop:516 length:267 start_codon:yes stop_codon:yes gene_type:complete
LRHSQSDNEQEKSGASDHGNRAAKLVQAVRIFKQLHHGCVLLNLSEETILILFCSHKNKIRTKADKICKLLILNEIYMASMFLSFEGK